jgi:maltose O-acetyltransferase
MINSLISLIRSYRHRKYLTALIARGLKIGRNSCVLDGVFLDPSHCFLISIGNNCVLSPNVRLIAHDASTKRILGYSKIGMIEIKDNCFIGDSALILPRVTIGPGSIVGAGAVVTKDVPPATIVAGNPARIISKVEDYKQKIIKVSSTKTIFTHDYYIDKLDDHKRNEIIRSIGGSIGFIV